MMGGVQAAQQDTGIQLTGVSKLFRRRKANGETDVFAALDSVTLHVPAAQFVSLIGPSGCGKTTLLRIVAGLEHPQTGDVNVNGKPIRGPGPERAMVFQHFALLPWADVIENVSFGLKLAGVDKRERERQARYFVELVGLTGFEHAHPRELSGGMQQRVGLARALAVDPAFLLLDEPFGALDEITRRVMQNELISIWERSRKTALFVTHSVDEAVFLSDRIIVMSSGPGRIVEDIQVSLPRPRTRDVEQSEEFQTIKAGIWSTLGL
jgi:ABC-type nitrate/sulfonate/bicarbonate transport system ATPase subunit